MSPNKGSRIFIFLLILSTEVLADDPTPLDEAMKTRLMNSLESGFRGSCEQEAENEFYKSLREADESELDALITNTLTAHRVCNRFRGLSCKPYFNVAANREDNYCTCEDPYYWGINGEERCIAQYLKPCGLGGKRQRASFQVESQFTNLNEEVLCPKDTFCSERGYCLCPWGKTCSFETSSGTNMENLHKEMRAAYREYTSRWQDADRFLDDGDHCDEQYNDVDFWHEEPAFGMRGYDYIRFKRWLDNKPKEYTETRLQCNILLHYVCREGRCQCRGGWTHGDLVDYNYECAAIEATPCNLQFYNDGIWYAVDQLLCEPSQYQDKAECRTGLDRISHLCCPNYKNTKTVEICPGLNDFDLDGVMPRVKLQSWILFFPLTLVLVRRWI